MNLSYIADGFTGFTGCYLSLGIQLQPAIFETGVKGPKRGDCISLFAIWVSTKLNLSGEAVVSFNFYLSPGS